MRLFSFLDFEAKKNSKSDFPPRKWPNFSNFEFLFWHCIGIIENNISTKFGDNRTNFGEIITISRFQCFLYSSGHSARGTSIVSTLLSLKNFWLEVRSWNFACSCRKGWSTTMHVFVRWACPGESQYRCGTTPPIDTQCFIKTLILKPLIHYIIIHHWISLHHYITINK